MAKRKTTSKQKCGPATPPRPKPAPHNVLIDEASQRIVGKVVGGFPIAFDIPDDVKVKEIRF